MTKKMMAVFGLVLSFLLGMVNVFAEEPTPSPTSETADEKKDEKKEEQPEENPDFGPEIKAQSAILIDAASGTVLARKNSALHTAPGGLTKLMGLYLACENIRDDKSITMSSRAFETYDHSTGVIWVMEGESIPAVDLEYASMIQNANDTMAMLAEEVSGSNEAFIEKMNQTASDLGMNNTQFSNIYGHYDVTNYTTAEDMAILTRKALRNPTLKKMFGAVSHTIAPTAYQTAERVLSQNCEMLREGNYYNPETVGCKLGYTKEGGYTLAAASQRGGLTLIAVILGEALEGDIYLDAKALFEYGYSRYQNVEITPEKIGTKTVEIYEGDKHVSDVIFSVTQSFSALLSTSVAPDDLKFEIVTMNEETNNPNLIEANVVFTLNGVQVGTAEMKKEIRSYDIVSDHPSAPITVKQIFDYFSIAVLGIIAVAHLARVFQPPQV